MEEGIYLNSQEKCETQSPSEDDRCVITAESENWPIIDVKNRIVSDATDPMQIPIEEECVGLPVETILMTDMESVSEEIGEKHALSQEEFRANPAATDYLPTSTENSRDFYNVDDVNSMEIPEEKHALTSEANSVVMNYLPTENPPNFYNVDNVNSMEISAEEKPVVLPDPLFMPTLNKPKPLHVKKKMGRPVKPPRQYECEVCHKCFPQQSRLNRHFLIHTGLKPFQCDICTKCFQQKSELFRHYLIHSGKTFSCSACEKCFSTKDDLNKHFRTHTGEQPFVCDVCLKGFSQKCNLNTHYRVHTKEKPYMCEVCNKCFSHKNRLATHTLIHTNEKSFECDVCHAFFNQKSYLMRHYRRHTQEKPFQCEVCNKQFGQKSTLNRHFRTHTGQKPHECDICHKRFGEKCTLTEHQRVHTQEKPYMCDICGHHFRKNNHLVNHRLIHTDEKPFHCEVCGQKFRKHDHLAKHRRIHTKEKPYTCDSCPRSFSRKEYLTSHYCEGVRDQSGNFLASAQDVYVPFVADTKPTSEIVNPSIDVCSVYRPPTTDIEPVPKSGTDADIYDPSSAECANSTPISEIVNTVMNVSSDVYASPAADRISEITDSGITVS